MPKGMLRLPELAPMIYLVSECSPKTRTHKVSHAWRKPFILRHKCRAHCFELRSWFSTQSLVPNFLLITCSSIPYTKCELAPRPTVRIVVDTGLRRVKAFDSAIHFFLHFSLLCAGMFCVHLAFSLQELCLLISSTLACHSWVQACQEL